MIRQVSKDMRIMLAMKSMRITWLIYFFAACSVTYLLKAGIAFLDIFSFGIDPGVYTITAGIFCLRIPLVFISIFSVLFVLSDENETDYNYAAPLQFYYKRFISKLICLTIYMAVFFIYIFVLQKILQVIVIPEFSEVGENFVSIFSFNRLSFLKFVLDMYLLYYATICLFSFVAILTRYKVFAVIISAVMSTGYISYLINTLSKTIAGFDMHILFQYVVTQRIFDHLYGYSIISDLILSAVYIIVPVSMCLIIIRKRWEHEFKK